MSRFLTCLLLAALVSLEAGCGPNGSSSPASTEGEPSKASARTAPLAGGKKLMLAAEPAGAKGVIAIRKEAKDGDEIVVAGRVGGSTKPFTEGRASFLLVDPSLKPTDGCETPWDFCEYPKKEVAAARLNVKFVDGDGKTVKNGARELFGISELSNIVIKGKVSRDDKDNVVVVASGIFVRADPK